MCAIPEIIVLMPLIWKVWVKSMIVIQWITEHMSECTWMTQWMCEWTSECWHHSSESYTQRYAPFCVSSRVTVWLQLFESCTGSQSLSGSSTSCACWFTSRLGHTPEYISDFLTSVANIPGWSTLRASSCGNLVVPWTRQRIGDKACSVAAPRAWNRLPTVLKLLWSTDLFRCDLKTFLFHSVDWLCDVPSVF